MLHQSITSRSTPAGDRAARSLTPVPRLIEAHAARNSGAIAVRHGARSITRGELVARATAIAHHLRTRGIGRDSVVAIRLDRSPEHIIACLGVLQAGAAFMSLDPADPVDRVSGLITNAGAAAAITDAGRAADHPGLAIVIDDPAIAQAEAGPFPTVHGDDLAYVAHTSGSSGTPNAVEITHANLANLVDWAQRAFAITADDRVSLALGLGFDAAIFELWPALAAGAAVHVVDDLVRTSPTLLQRQLLDERITIATAPTALVEPLVAMAWPADAALRWLSTGGDVLRVRPRAALPFRLVNNYGPTECTCEATWSVVSPDASAGLPPIGRAIDGVAIYLLDDEQRPVLAGDEGEIWIGGRSVGRGYRNNAALTAQKFRLDPFATAPGARMYRTGDRGRMLASGEIAFCGRSDRQVKIGGVRIELDEVAAVLQAHWGIETAIVTARDGALIAHVVPMSAMPDAIELRRFLAQRLPRAYLPRAFVAIAQVPLTRNGKIDHDALPPPASDVRSTQDDTLTAPERRVIGIVGDVLGCTGVSLGDNFFLLGGQSLQATEVVVRCRGAFGVSVALADLLGADTIGGFVSAIHRRIAQSVAMMSDEEVRAALGG